MRSSRNKSGCCAKQYSNNRSFWSRHRGAISGLTVVAGTAAGAGAGYLVEEYCPYLKAFGLLVNVAVGAGIGLGLSGIPIAIANIVTSCSRRQDYDILRTDFHDEIYGNDDGLNPGYW